MTNYTKEKKIIIKRTEVNSGIDRSTMDSEDEKTLTLTRKEVIKIK